MPTGTRYSLLGPLEVVVDGRAVALTGRQRALLTILLLDAGQVVSVERIADRLWEGRPPSSAPARVRALIAELRRMLGVRGPEIIATRSPGYLIRVGAGELDSVTFASRISEACVAADAGRLHEALDLYDEALGLWRGEPAPAVLDVSSAAEFQRLSELRGSALEGRADALLGLGQYDTVISDQRAAAAEQPLRERLRGQLMLALYRAGRTAEALKTYRDFRDLLVAELGAEPTPGLQRLHRQILENDPELAPPRGAPVPASERPSPPRQLPPEARWFVGRGADLEVLDRAHAEGDGLVVIAGSPGVGKTALAVHWARRAADLFPDGQLFLDMRGFTEGESVSVAQVLPQLLQGLGCLSSDIPVAVEAQIAAYRSLLADRRILLVLDDVTEPAQVRALLPTGLGCMTVVTSRDRLSGLLALDGARRHHLDVLSEHEALQLLAHGVGEQRLHHEHASAVELAGLCQYLPLVLRVAAARLSDRRHCTIGDYVRDLRERGRLERLDADGDGRTTIRAALEKSYETLKPASRRMFRLLSLVPAHDVSVSAAAALAGIPRAQADDQLDDLARVHLLTQTEADRYTCHDLLLEYAAGCARREDSEADREEAVVRLLEYLMESVLNVVRTAGLVHSLPQNPAPAGVGQESFPTEEQAWAWVTKEFDNIVAALTHAAEHGPRMYAWLLVDGVQDVLHHRRTLVEWLRIADIGLQAARAEGDLTGQAAMHLSLGHARWRLTELHTALREYEQGRTLARAAAWRKGEAIALMGGGVAHKQLGCLADAVGRYEQSVAVYRELGHEYGEALGLSNLASANFELAHLEEAESGLLAALRLTDRCGSKNLEALTLVNLGRVRQEQHRPTESRRAHEQALRVAADAAFRYARAEACNGLGRILVGEGAFEEAAAMYGLALELARTLESVKCQTDALVGLAEAELRQSGVGSATRRLRAALVLADHAGYRAGQVEAGLVQAEIHRVAGDYAQAGEEARRALDLAQAARPVAVASAHCGLAEIHRSAGDLRGCVTECERSLRVSARTGQRLVQARALVVLAAARWDAGDERTSLRCRSRAARLSEEA
ncbi:BTAD domain-containing putative transcriptional regulator [Streptomyces aculeolatus]|uniref:AfsR/SARP family transcriptional regulator n=1 Tax=Streptomyces aculeolatus TaxID=270689 RepID=UPI001CEDF0D5|nr:BTAD domain-containing putative transcriptional regulator [Streptomyces aculeolatus]